MIERVIIPILLIIVLSDLYIDIHYFRRHYHLVWWKRLLWWLPCMVMVGYTCALASIRNFVPSDITWIDIYLFLIGLFYIPKGVFTFWSSLGWVARKFITHTHRNWGHYLGLVLGAVTVGMFFYGLTVGVRRFRVVRQDLWFSNLPPEFDGYRIVLFSDAHVGSFDRFRHKLLQRDIDSINAQKADLIVFAGDLQNTQPSDIDGHARALSSLSSTDGVVSVLGNHDYSRYTGYSTYARLRNEQLTIERELQMGWILLRNQHKVIRRGADSIVVAGEENGGKPKRDNLKKTLAGVSPFAFTILVQHDPRVWDADILPHSTAELTLSGHTHGGQVSLFGLRPTQLFYREDYGLYEHKGRYLYVSGGIGGVVPFRLGMTPEINVITLHLKQ